MRNFVVLLMVLTLFSCHKKESITSKEQYPTMTVKTTDASLESRYPCVIKGKQNVEIRPQISGMITSICTDEGASIKKGDVLFIIDQEPYKVALESAEANMKSAGSQVNTARLTANNKKELFREQVISEYDLQKALNDLQVAEASLAQAEAEVSNAHNNLSYTVLKSPVDGVCGMIPYRVGTFVGPSVENPLVTVSNMDEMYAYFSMTESQMLDMVQQQGAVDSLYSTSRPIGLTLSNGTKYKETGHVNAISGTVDSESGVIDIRVVFPNPERLLRNGGSGILSIPDYRKDCFIIPLGATYEIQDRVYVYKVTNGKTCATQVSITKMNDGKHCIVEEGLVQGDIIISEGAGLLRNGVDVQI